jgi:hypothetical protein
LRRSASHGAIHCGQVFASDSGTALPGFMSSASAIAGQTFSQAKTSPLVTLNASLRAASASPAHAMARAKRSTSTACETRAAPPG